MLDVELRRRRQLDPLGLAERALGEGREPAHRVDLVAEQLDPDGALLGRPEDVEDPAADRELAPLLDLLDSLVAGADQVLGDRAEVDLVPAGDDEAGGPKRGVGDGLGERHGAGDDDRVTALAERVEGIDPEADEVRRRGDVRGVAGPPRRVEPDPARRQVGGEVGGEVAGGAVVGADQERRPPGEAAIVLEDRREEQRPQGARGAHADRLAAAGRRRQARPRAR